jgi:hypothetical protein
MLLALIFNPCVLNLERSISKGQVLEVNLLDQTWRFVLLHQRLHCFLKAYMASCQQLFRLTPFINAQARNPISE